MLLTFNLVKIKYLIEDKRYSVHVGNIEYYVFSGQKEKLIF